MKHFERVPVIVLPNVVFYPNTSLPLYIADDRYEELIEKAIQDNSFIGVALERSTENDIQNIPFNIFGMGRPIILERMENGILKVLLKGVSRAKVIEVEQALPYPVYLAELIPDDHNFDINFINQKSQDLRRILNEWLKSTITDEFEREQFIQTMQSTKQIVDYVCTFLIQDKEIRQILLENTNLQNRIDLIHLIVSKEYPYQENCDVCEAIKDFQDFEHIAKIAN